jgi:galactose mutarotase-like enzyme
MILENENIKIECLPSHGGKLSSIYDKKKNFELLFQNPKEEYKKAELGAEFSAFER